MQNLISTLHTEGIYNVVINVHPTLKELSTTLEYEEYITHIEAGNFRCMYV